jgi:hypothetical protein
MPDIPQKRTKQPSRPPKAVKIPTIKQQKIITMKQQHPDLSMRDIAAVCNTDAANVCRVLHAYGINKQMVDEYKQHRADVFAGMQYRILSSITTDDIQTASLMQRSAALGILYDKERLERNMSTSNTLSIHTDIAALQAREPEEAPGTGGTGRSSEGE